MAARKAVVRKGGKRPAKGGRRGNEKPRSSRGIAILAMFGVVMFAATALPLFVVTAGGLVPTIVALVVDHHRAKYLTRTVGAMNLAGVAPMIIRLWSSGDNLSAALAILARPVNWLVMYGAAGIGWCIFLAMPAVARIIVDLQAEQVQSQLRERAERLVEEWGEEVKGRPDDEPLPAVPAPKAKGA
ncbi:MAG TPA: hypothetical protein VMC10_05200 [Stellaceae bacterium]|nr:hypothetical protein [Stellaceae bacterium]